MGLEPTRAYTHKILSLACLPIPALPHIMQKKRLELSRYCYHTDLNRARLPIPPLLHTC